MGRNGLKYRKLKIFGIAAGLAGVLFLAGCTKTAGQNGCLLYTSDAADEL